jgi:hypothetical protein
MLAKRISGDSELDETMICYWHPKDDGWLVYFPKCGIGALQLHKVEEHDDGTISVTPSILTKGHDEGKETTVHGYLTHGVWRDC